MYELIKICFIVLISLALESCSTRLDPKDLDIKSIVSPVLQNIKPVAVRAKTIGTKEKVLPIAGSDIIVNEDEFTQALAERLIATLKQNNVPVVPGADRVIEVQVVKVALQPDRTHYCVIDFNRRLGNDEFFGFQSRSKNWNYETACEEALNNTVTDLLSDQDTVKYLKGE